MKPVDGEAINRFVGEHEFLSNFFPSTVTYEGDVYETVEHAFQAAKTLSVGERRQIRNAASPGRAKRMGRQATLREGWDSMRVDVMRELLRAKFSDPELQGLLLDTGNRPLLEGNTWNDRFWGVCLRTGRGQNWLGRLLMEVRDELSDR